MAFVDFKTDLSTPSWNLLSQFILKNSTFTLCHAKCLLSTHAGKDQPYDAFSSSNSHTVVSFSHLTSCIEIHEQYTT
jgi:hypothetical protein